jgi:hydrogenase maturation protease
VDGQAPTLVVGVGTDRGDDAAGLLVARRLRETAPPRGTGQPRVVELAGDLTRLLDLWQPADRVTVVDATTSGAAPGTVHVLDAGARPLPASLGTASTHALTLADAVELARSLGRLPARLVVYGIEGARWSPGEPPTAPVAAAVDRVAAALLGRSGRPRDPGPLARARRPVPG